MNRRLADMLDHLFSFDITADLLRHDFVQQALVAAALLGLVSGLIGPFIVMRQMSFAVHGSSELSLTGAAFALLIGFEVGADDYMVKPFDVGELKARLRALLRRANPEDDGDGLCFAELRLDAERHGARVGESFVELTRTEYQLLELLMLNPRRVLSHSLIYDRVWGYDFGPASNALRVYVGYLRRKLEQAGARDLIHTVRGVGYALREP